MSATKPARWQASGWHLLWVPVLVIILDQISKQWILASLSLYERINVLPFFDIVHARNYGAAFSFLSDAGGWQRWFFTLLAIAVSGLLIFWLRKQTKDEWRLNWSFNLIIGGAIGNVLDRLQHGFVVDFLDVYLRLGEQTHHWPAFNVADSAIVIGAALMIWDGITNRKT
ncbi:lipoprotein signal peptidase [Aliidiomarina minuta]|uniref:Lipoprotein signal peptidase n=1 Tax=Aliidiomarina minuta TaxID=880057 RepID=A0A432W8C6_9GAMM|nr:signal peptidase II [Aliidiomarina minuta]RUO26377.1 lipoprotein signal peptidase [Aliidiomarina minuta]